MPLPIVFKVDPYTSLTNENAVSLHNHILGQCLRVKNHAIIYIPKNASSLLRTCISNNKAVPACWYDFNVREFWVILRDPFERWISGTVEHLKEFSINDYNEASTRAKLIYIDQHTAPQIWFLKGCFTSGKKINYVYLNKDGLNLVDSKLKIFSSKYSNSIPPKVHHTYTDDSKKFYVDMVHKILTDNPSLPESIKKFYSEDYKLINEHLPGYSIN